MCDDANDPGNSETTDQPESTDVSPTTVRHNWTQSDQPSVTIVEAVSAATDRATTDLPPLQDAIESDALDALLNGPSSSVVVSFRYADTGVTVNGNGNVSIEIQVDGDFREEDGE